MRLSKVSRIVALPVAALGAFSVLIFGPGVMPAYASTTCSLPVGAGAVTPSGGNTVALGSTSVAVGTFACDSLDLDSYTVTIHLGIFYADGSVCGWGGNTGLAIGGVGTVPGRATCTTPYNDPRANQLQTLHIWGTTSNGVTTAELDIPMA